MGNTYSQLFIHLVFSTKKRAPKLKPKFEEGLKSYIYNYAKKNELQILAMGGTQNHLHLLLVIPPKFSVSKTAQVIKGSSSRWLNKNYFQEEKFRWQKGYGAFSINKSLVPKTIAYIENQKKHHANNSYQDEFVSFLDKHNLTYDQ